MNSGGNDESTNTTSASTHIGTGHARSRPSHVSNYRLQTVTVLAELCWDCSASGAAAPLLDFFGWHPSTCRRRWRERLLAIEPCSPPYVVEKCLCLLSFRMFLHCYSTTSNTWIHFIDWHKARNQAKSFCNELNWTEATLLRSARIYSDAHHSAAAAAVSDNPPLAEWRHSSVQQFCLQWMLPTTHTIYTIYSYRFNFCVLAKQNELNL